MRIGCIRVRLRQLRGVQLAVVTHEGLLSAGERLNHPPRSPALGSRTFLLANMSGFLRVLLSRRPRLIPKANVGTPQRANYIISKPAKDHIGVAVSTLHTWVTTSIRAVCDRCLLHSQY